MCNVPHHPCSWWRRWWLFLLQGMARSLETPVAFCHLCHYGLPAGAWSWAMPFSLVVYFAASSFLGHQVFVTSTCNLTRNQIQLQICFRNFQLVSMPRCSEQKQECLSRDPLFGTDGKSELSESELWWENSNFFPALNSQGPHSLRGFKAKV